MTRCDGGEVMARTIVWFSCGAASAVAARLTLRNNPDAIVAYCETGSEHPDNERFMADCVRWFNAPVVRLKSDKYTDIWDVYEKRKYLSGINGAPCTKELKVVPRLNAYDLPSDIHVFGYTADKSDINRATKL
jgi:3'-phosphoadenosine 5'-phosphosulfate sulfotransferase (PAPS reductase)/FAD synthetase